MPSSLIKLIASQPLLRIVRGFLLSPKPRHLRDLAASYSLSPAGTTDIMRRLIEAGLIVESREGNRRYFSLKIDAVERQALLSFFKVFEFRMIEERAVEYSRGAAKKLEWMDEANEFFRQVKRRKHATT